MRACGLCGGISGGGRAELSSDKESEIGPDEDTRGHPPEPPLPPPPPSSLSLLPLNTHTATRPTPSSHHSKPQHTRLPHPSAPPPPLSLALTMLPKPLALGLLALAAVSAAAPTNFDGQLAFGNPTLIPELELGALQIPSPALAALGSLAIPREHLAELQAHIAGLPERRRVQLGEGEESVIEITEGEKVSALLLFHQGGGAEGRRAVCPPVGEVSRGAGGGWRSWQVGSRGPGAESGPGAGRTEGVRSHTLTFCPSFNTRRRSSPSPALASSTLPTMFPSSPPRRLVSA